MINLEKYRDKWLAKNVDEFIGFYPREFFCFDNFSAFSFIYEGIRFHTVEHAYQAYKFKATAPKLFDEIVNCYSPDEAKRIAHRNEDKVVVEGINISKRHTKPRTNNDKGGIFEIEMPIHVSNVKKVEEAKKEAKKASKEDTKEAKATAKKAPAKKTASKKASK